MTIVANYNLHSEFSRMEKQLASIQRIDHIADFQREMESLVHQLQRILQRIKEKRNNDWSFSLVASFRFLSTADLWSVNLVCSFWRQSLLSTFARSIGLPRTQHLGVIQCPRDSCCGLYDVNSQLVLRDNMCYPQVFDGKNWKFLPHYDVRTKDAHLVHLVTFHKHVVISATPSMVSCSRWPNKFLNYVLDSTHAIAIALDDEFLYLIDNENHFQIRDITFFQIQRSWTLPAGASRTLCVDKINIYILDRETSSVSMYNKLGDKKHKFKVKQRNLRAMTIWNEHVIVGTDQTLFLFSAGGELRCVLPVPPEKGTITALLAIQNYLYVQTRNHFIHVIKL